MVVCKFFQQGNCRFGDKCRNEHISADPNQGQNHNRFGVFGGLSGGGNQSNGSGLRYGLNANTGQRYGNGKDLPYNLDGKVIEQDLKNDRPLWPMSAYGPGKDAPRLLFSGDYEQSPEEMRYRYYLAKSQGREENAKQEEAVAAQKMNEMVQTALKDIDAVIDFVLKGADERPNRLDIINGKGVSQIAAGQLGSQATPFGQPSIGQGASATQGNSSPFGAATGSNVAFGKPSFGQPSAPATSSPFGQPSALGQNSAFGKSTFGQQPSVPTSAFGQTSSLNRSSPFGQPQSQPQSSPFGQATAPSALASPFGQVSAAPAQSSPFGQISATPAQPSPFGQVSGSNNQAGPPQSNPFGQVSALGNQASPFGQPAVLGSQSSPFGQPTGLARQSSPFGQTNQTSSHSNPFGQSTALGAVSQAGPFAKSPFGQAAASAAPNPFGQASAVSTQQQNGTQASPFNQAAGGSGEAAPTKSDDPPDEAYGGHEVEFKKAYDYIKQHGSFEGGIMPTVAPKYAWITG